MKRYKLVWYKDDDYSDMEEAEDGEYVKWDDVKAMVCGMDNDYNLMWEEYKKDKFGVNLTPKGETPV